MPPAKKSAANQDDTASGRDKPNTSAPTSRKARNGAVTANAPTQSGGSSLKELALVSAEAGTIATANAQTPGTGMAWQTAPLDLLETYRVAYNLPTPSAFTSPLTQALLTNPGLGRQSPTMARKREKRRISKEQLALAVRKNFNAAAVNEIDVVVDLMYKVRNQGKAFRMRSNPGMFKKPP